MYLVGGYYDNRYFQHLEENEYGILEAIKDNDVATFDKNIDIYTIEEALKLPFVDGVVEWYEETICEDIEFHELNEDEQVKYILEYVESDEIASLVKCNTLEEAISYKNEVLKNIKQYEDEYELVGHKQDSYGYYHDVMQKKG